MCRRLIYAPGAASSGARGAVDVARPPRGLQHGRHPLRVDQLVVPHGPEGTNFAMTTSSSTGRYGRSLHRLLHPGGRVGAGDGQAGDRVRGDEQQHPEREQHGCGPVGRDAAPREGLLDGDQPGDDRH